MSSLPLLQSQIRRDPSGYEQEYRIQFRSFETTAQTFHVTPGRPHKHFQELVSFIAHVYPCYPQLREELDFPQILFATLRKEPERIHPSPRKVMVAALLALLRRDAVPLMTVMTELFRLFAVEDKELRSLLRGRLLSEISTRTSTVGGKKRLIRKSGSVHIPPSEMKKRVQDFLMKLLNSAKGTSELVLREVAGIVCGMYKRKDWVDDFTVNSMMTALCRCEDSKVSSASMHVFLGESTFAAAMLDDDKRKKPEKNLTKFAAVSSDEEEDGSKRSKKKNKQNTEETDFSAIDALMEPYSFAEDLLKRASGTGKIAVSFEYRLLCLRVVCRTVYRRELVLPNLYPFLEKYLFPSNRMVTKILSCLAQSCHANVPPEEMASVVRHVLNHFVSDHCRPEVLTVGLNALRGICERAPLALSRDQLADIVQFRMMKTSKSVSCAARALLNVYRDIHPELLHRNLRGKDASIAVQRGTAAQGTVFGASSHVHEDVQGIHLLAALKRKREQVDEEDEEGGEEGDDDEEGDDEEEDDEEDDEEEDDDDDEEEDDEEEDDDDEEDDDENDASNHSDDNQDEEKNVEDKLSGLNLSACTVLGNVDFRRIKKLRTVVAENGSIGSEDMNTDDEDESEVDEPDWILNPSKLGDIHKGGKQASGDATLERKVNMKLKSETRRGSLTNKEKRRNKPIMMSVQREHGRKRNKSAAQKFKELRTHISNLKKQVGPQKRRRTGKNGKTGKAGGHNKGGHNKGGKK